MTPYLSLSPSAAAAGSAHRRRVSWSLGLSLVALLLASACGGGPDPEKVAQGQELFLKTCATCHGKDARGVKGQGKSLHDNAFVQARSDTEMLAFIKVGRRPTDPLNTTGVDMPPKGGNPALSEQDLGLIITFVRSLQP